MEILLNQNYVSIDGFLRLEASGGVEPYTYSLLSGGDGGSIGSDGIYYSPSLVSVGYQIIRATDNVGDFVDQTVYIYSPLQVLCRIIKDYTEIDSDQIYIYNQKFTVPNDKRSYVSVGISNQKTFASNQRNEEGIETIVTNVQLAVKIDIIGNNKGVFDLKDKVIASFASQLSQKIQVENNIKIGRIPVSTNDLSGIEGTAIPYRYNISINMLYATKRVSSVEYYDTFQEPSVIKDLSLGYLLTDDFGFLLQEDGSRIVL